MSYADDLSNLGLISGGAQGFIKGMQDADDRKFKQMEFDSKMKAQDEEKQRRQLETAIQLRQANLQVDPGTQQLSDAPLTQKQTADEDISAGKSGMRLKRDATTHAVTGFDYDPNSPQVIGAYAKQDANGVRREALAHKGDVGNKDWGKLSDALDPNKARGGNLAKVQGVINSSDRIHAIFKQFPDGNIPAAQTNELATAVAGLISGGSPQSQHQIDQIVPQSAQGKAQDMVAWLTGNPTGRQQQAFIRVLQQTSENERAVASKQKLDAQRARLPQFDYLKSSDPDKYHKILHGFEVTEDGEDQSPGGIVPQGLTTQGAGLVGGQANTPPAADAALAAKLQRLDALKAKAAGGG